MSGAVRFLCLAAIIAAGCTSDAFADRTRIMRFRPSPASGAGGAAAWAPSTRSTLFVNASGDDYVSFADRAGFTPGGGLTTFSAACWVRFVTADRADNPFIMSQNDGVDGAWYMAMTDDGSVGHWVLRVAISASGADFANYRTGNFTEPNAWFDSLNTWYLISWSYNGAAAAASRIVMYKNGTLSPSPIGTGTIPATMRDSAVPVAIGSWPAQAATYALDGYLDECATYQCTLSADDMLLIYNGGTPADLMALATTCQPSWWDRMGENPGTNPNQSDELGGVAGTCTNMSSTNCVSTMTVPP